MGAIGGFCLLFGLFFLYKTFTAQNFFSGRGVHLFGEDASKLDCGCLAAILLFAAFEIFWNM